MALKEEDAGAEHLPLISLGELKEVVVDPQEKEVAGQEESLNGGLIEACKEGRAEDAWWQLKSKNPALSEKYINYVDKDGATALMWACGQGMKDVAIELIARGAKRDVVQKKENLNDHGKHRITYKDTPLILACYNRHEEIAMELLKPRKGQQALGKEHINLENYDHDTALDFAVSNRLSEVTVELLKQGANGKNKAKLSSVQFSSEDFRGFLDELVTMENGDHGEHDKLVFNYKFLYEDGHDNTPILDSILNMSPDHKELVKHPLVKAILVEKWNKMFPMWFVWIIFKIIFFGLIVAFASVLYTSSKSETVESGAVSGQLVNGATRDSGQNLTLPDLFKTVKTPPNAQTAQTKNETSNTLEFVTDNWLLTIPQVTFGVLTLFFWCVELMQIRTFKKKWVTEVRNWLQLIILGISTYICFAMCLGSCPDDEMSHLIATLLPLVYYEGLYEVGYHYKLSKYINMFNRVLKTFCRYFLAYIGLIVCFAGGKAIMLLPSKQANFPSTFWGLLPKMFVMLTGEQEFMNIPFVSSVGYRTWETMYFLVFLMLTVVILLNMLNGLAVADAKEMLDESEKDSLCSLLSLAAFWVEYVGKEEDQLNSKCNMKWLRKYAGILDKDMDQEEATKYIYDFSIYKGIYQGINPERPFYKSNKSFTIDNGVKKKALEIIKNKKSKKQEKEKKEAEDETQKRIFEMLQQKEKKEAEDETQKRIFEMLQGLQNEVQSLQTKVQMLTK